MGTLKRFSYDNIVIHDPTAPDPVEGGGGDGGKAPVVLRASFDPSTQTYSNPDKSFTQLLDEWGGDLEKEIIMIAQVNGSDTFSLRNGSIEEGLGTSAVTFTRTSWGFGASSPADFYFNKVSYTSRGKFTVFTKNVSIAYTES